MSKLFSPVGTTQRRDITTSAVRIALAGLGLMVGGTVRIFVEGSDTVFIAFGDGTVEAGVAEDEGEASGMPIAAGRETGLTVPAGATHLSAVCASGEASVYITAGDGV